MNDKFSKLKGVQPSCFYFHLCVRVCVCVNCCKSILFVSILLVKLASAGLRMLAVL